MNNFRKLLRTLGLVPILALAAPETIKQNVLSFGKGDSSNKRFIFNKGLGATNPEIRWDNASSTFKTCIAGTCSDIGSGGGGGGGENFLGAFGDFEAGLGSWAAYQDASSSIPADCSGGSPSVTVTSSASSPLQKLASGLYTKGASNVQGQGISVPFSIEPSAQGHLVQVQGTVSLVSGTYVEGQMPTKSDTIVYFYDVTNASIVHPTSDFNINPGIVGAKGTFQAAFQSNLGSNSYRMCIHQASTSASAYVLKFDEIVIGRNATAQGPVVSDWESFTPTGTWVTNTTYTGKYRRIGDSAEIDVTWATSGAPTATNLTIDFSAVCTADTAKMTSTTNVANGIVRAIDTGNASYPAIVNLTSSTVAQMTRIIADTGTTGLDGALDDSTPFAWGAGDSGNARFTVPCAGWATSSTSAKGVPSGRTLAAKIYLSGAQSVATSPGNAIIAFDAVDNDNAGLFDVANNRIKITESGNYSVAASVGYIADSTGARSMVVRKNGVTNIINKAENNAGGSFLSIVSGADPSVPLLAGEYIDVLTEHTQGAPLALVQNSATTYLSVKKNTDNVGVLAQPKVFASYKSNSGQSISDGVNTQLDLEDLVEDSHGAVTTGVSWNFRAPYNLVYTICGNIKFQATGFTGGSDVELGVVNQTTAEVKYLGSRAIETTNTIAAGVGGCTKMSMLAGQQLYFFGYQLSGGAKPLTTTADYVWVTISN